MVRKIRHLLARPEFDVSVFVLILFSVLSLILEVVSQDQANIDMFEAAGHWINFLFWVELSLRFAAAPVRAHFFREYWLDLISILPVPAIPAFRVFRMLRLIRFLRLYRAGIIVNRRFSRYTNAFFDGSGELFLIGFVVFMVVAFGSTGMYFVQRNLAGSIQTFEDAFWFSLFTMMSGQPNDPPAYSTAGKVIAFVVICAGEVIFAMFVGLVSAVVTDRMRRQLEASPMDLESLENHLVICGWNSSGVLLLNQIHSSNTGGTAVVVIAEKELLLRDQVLRGDLIYTVVGDPTRIEVLKAAGVERAGRAILLADQTVPRNDQDRDARSILTALMVERLNPRIRTCVELLSSTNESYIRQAGIENIIVPSEYGALIMSSLVVHEAIAATHEELLDRNRGNSYYLSDCPPDLIGLTFTEVVTRLKRQHDVLLIGIEEPAPPAHGQLAHPKPQVHLNPPADRKIAAGEKLVVMARAEPKLGKKK